jgi:hypothetical protein
MKALLFSLLLLPQFVQAEGLDKRGEKYVDKIIKCTRKTIDQRRGGTQSVEIAYRYLTEAKFEKDSDRLKQLYKECKKERKSHKRRRQPWPEIFKAHLEVNTQSDPDVGNLIGSFIRPWGVCKAGGVDLLVGAGLSLGVGMKAGKCRGSNGKKYIAVVPEFMFGIGIGAHAGMSFNRWHFNMRRYFAIKSGGLNANTGMFFSISKPVIDEGTGESYGVGLGLHMYGQLGRGMRLIPLGTDEDYLRKKLFKTN